MYLKSFAGTNLWYWCYS